MVEATQAYHPIALPSTMEKEPSTRGEKVSDYLPKDIVIMAHLLLVTRPQEFVDRAKASAIVKKVQADPA